jgi:hypothetical protein
MTACSALNTTMNSHLLTSQQMAMDDVGLLTAVANRVGLGVVQPFLGAQRLVNAPWAWVDNSSTANLNSVSSVWAPGQPE